MKESDLRNTITEAVSLDREIAEKTDRLKSLKGILATEASTRVQDHTGTAGGGSSWTAEGNDGCIVRVTFPSAKLKSSIKGEGSSIEKIRKLTGRFFTQLFTQIPNYAPVSDFRNVAQNLLGKDSRKLIKTCETTSAPTVSFETKEAA